MTSDLVTADVVSAGEFRHLTAEYYVYGIPKTVVNDQVQFEGTRPEADFIEQVLKA